MKITIAGFGFVGQAYAELLHNTCEVTIIDPAYPEHNKSIPSESDAVIICVSTPEDNDGGCDMSNVFDVIEHSPNVPILIKSTISLAGWQGIRNCYVVGVGNVRDISFSPEFLRAKTAWQDLLDSTEIYIGGGNITFWGEVFKKCYVHDINILTMSVEELILIKYFRNSFLATKVSFFNQVYDLCEAANVDYKNVATGIGMDKRIGKSHTDVNTERGFGGHCFPKDTKAILQTAGSFDVSLSLIEESNDYNINIRKEI